MNEMTNVVVRAVLWLLPRLAVIVAILFVVEFGGLSRQPFDLLSGIVSWTIVWVAIDYYCRTR
jgi:hypothetical protein